MHYRDCRWRPPRGSSDALEDREEPERPRYGKDMHPSNRHFSAQNTTTPSSFDSRQIPLERTEDEEEMLSSVSDSVTTSYVSQAPDSPPLAVSNSRAWDETRTFRSHQDHLRPAAPFSEDSGSSSGLPVPQYSERYFERLGSRSTSHPVEDQFEDAGGSQAAQSHSIHGSSAYPSSSHSHYDTSSTADSVSYSYIAPDSLPLRSREYIPTPSPAPHSPQDGRGRERNRPVNSSSARSSSIQSEYRIRPVREPRYIERTSRQPPRTSECRRPPQEHRHERSRSRMFRHVEARPSRSERDDDPIPGEDYAARNDHDDYSRAPYSPSGRGHSHRTGGEVFPGDRSQFSPSYLQEMGRLRFGETGTHHTREDEGQYDQEEYNSDDHMFTTEDLRDMARIRYWRSGERF